MEKKQYEIILGQAHNIISSKEKDIAWMLKDKAATEAYKDNVKAYARVMVETYKEVFEVNKDG